MAEGQPRRCARFRAFSDRDLWLPVEDPADTFQFRERQVGVLPGKFKEQLCQCS
ncbi:MAG: hypothetical protein QCH35_01105 [Methanomicrobiaceae archaeon]|nr:hypothetical protein [Methanomicrobiaceae archaeon]